MNTEPELSTSKNSIPQNGHTVCVIGCGVIGISTAVALCEKGFKVIVIDGESQPASGASGQNGGQLSYSYVDALGTGSLLKKLPKLALGLDDAFKLKAEASIHQAKWLISFLANCTDNSFRTNTHALLALSTLSKLTLDNWIEHYKPKFEYRVAGKLLLCNEDTLKFHTNNIEMKSTFGIEQEVLNKEETIALEPFLADTDNDFTGSIYAPDDAVGDAKMFVADMKRILETDYEVEFRMGEEISSVSTENGKLLSVHTDNDAISADAFVICAGIGSMKIASMLNEALPLQPMAGYSIDVGGAKNMPEISLTDTGSKTVLCSMDNKLRFAGLADLGFDHTQPRRIRETQLLGEFNKLYGRTTESTDIDDVWIGTRPMTSDSRPIIIKAGTDATYLNCGHGMFGWTLAAGSACVCADMIHKDLLST